MNTEDRFARLCTALDAVESSGVWRCRCPVHQGSKQNFHITLKNGKILANCKAGCDWEQVREALNNLAPFEGNTFVQHQKRPTYTYIYTDENGEYLYEKFKFWNEKTGKKDMRCRRKQPHGEYVWNIKDVRRVLYNLPNVLRAVRDKQIIYIVEGEKDADTLNKLGLVATTSITTSQWPHEFSKLLAGARVVIIPDNDAAGEKGRKVRAASLSKEVAELKVLNLPLEIKDVTEWFELGKTLEDFRLLIEDSEQVEERGKKKDAKYDDYIILAKEYLGDLKRDIFSDDLCYLDQFSGFWVPVLNCIQALRSAAIQKTTDNKKFKPSEIESHLAFLERSLRPGFVKDLPAWDGRDYLKELTNRIYLKKDPNNSALDTVCFEELLKHWHAKMWLRLVDPTIRNEVFILAGPQNVGKDFWIRENCGALGQFLVNFAICNNENDTKAQLHQGLVMNISEFDRTSKAEVSLLKEIITTTHTNLRFSYDARAKPRDCRCSFIASCNPTDIFNDPTGHTRYVFFEIEDIDRTNKFSADEQLQVLAQGLHLALSNYKPSSTSLAAMREQIDGKTPDSESDLIIARWDALASELYDSLTASLQDQCCNIRDREKKFFAFIPNSICFGIITTLAKEFGKRKPQFILTPLKNAGRARVDPDLGRGYYFVRQNSILFDSGHSDHGH